MSVLRRLLSGTYRRARIAEARGLYRDAAALYAASGADDEAAKALLEVAERSERFEDGVAAYRDALRWCGPTGSLRGDLLRRYGGFVLARVRATGLPTEPDRRLLEQAARGLDEAGAHIEAAEAWERLGAWDEVAASLQRAGELERLERLLEARGGEAARQRELGACLVAFRDAMATGARAEAQALLGRAATLAPDDASVAALGRELAQRRLRADAIRLRMGGDRTLLLVAADVLQLGRDAPLSLRGASVSRLHARARRMDDRIEVEDLGSRNGTLVDGFLVEGILALDPPATLGLGSDVELTVTLEGEDALGARVERGVDRGLEIHASLAPLAPEGFGRAVAFREGWPTIVAGPDAPVRLDGRPCYASIELLLGDVVEVGDTRVEVIG